MAFKDVKEHISRLEEIYQNGFAPDWDDLEHVYDTMRERAPFISIEFGSGYSTPVMFQAARDNERGSVFSLESDPAFFMGMLQYLGKHKFLDMATNFQPAETHSYYLFSALQSDSHGVCRYSYMPIRYADFIYVDGPPLLGQQRLLGNVWDLFPLPKTMIVDGRPMQCAEISARIGNFYDMDRDDVKLRTTYRMKKSLEGAMFHIDAGRGWYRKDGWS